jgi:hypothetical protein
MYTYKLSHGWVQIVLVTGSAGETNTYHNIVVKRKKKDMKSKPRAGGRYLGKDRYDRYVCYL